MAGSGEDGQGAKYVNLEEVVGQVLTVARDQNGCRFLQRKFDEGGAAAVAVVFPEVSKQGKRRGGMISEGQGVSGVAG